MEKGFQRPQRNRLSQQCVESIKAYIAQNDLKPGQRLPTEQEWVTMLGVSRLVVREALQTLSGLGIIDIQQGRGAFVRDRAEINLFDQVTFGLNLNELHYDDVLEARAMLDLAVLELCIARGDQQALADLDALLDQMEALEASGQSIDELHRRFHRRMLDAAGNPLLAHLGRMLMDTFWQIGDRIPGLTYRTSEPIATRYIERHRALVDAIRHRDFSRSRQLVVEHLPFPPGSTKLFPLITELSLLTDDTHERG